MRQVDEFELFGKTYRSKQFAAVPGLVLMRKWASINPPTLLRSTEIMTEAGWTALNSRAVINAHVFDPVGILSPLYALLALVDEVRSLNFGFLDGWEGVKVPSRFTSDANSVSSQHVEPLVSSLVSEGVATMRDLEEYFSLEDAFKLMDVLVTKQVNSALANEAAMRNARNKQ